MKSDLKKHNLLDILSKQRGDKEKPLGLSYNDICDKLKINRNELDELSGELYGEQEIGYFNDGINDQGLHTNSKGYSSFSSEKYKRRYWRSIWIMIRNWTALILAIFTIPFQIYRHLDNKESKETQELNKDCNQDTEMKAERKEITQDTTSKTLD